MNHYSTTDATTTYYVSGGMVNGMGVDLQSFLSNMGNPAAPQGSSKMGNRSLYRFVVADSRNEGSLVHSEEVIAEDGDDRVIERVERGIFAKLVYSGVILPDEAKFYDFAHWRTGTSGWIRYRADNEE